MRTLNGGQYGHWGVALMWHNITNDAVEIIDTYSNRIAVIKVSLHSRQICAVHVYLPCNGVPLESFKSEIDNLHDLVNKLNKDTHVILLGDFNSRLSDKDSFSARDRWVTSLSSDYNLQVITHIEAEVPNLLTSDENSVSRSLFTPVTYCELLTMEKNTSKLTKPVVRSHYVWTYRFVGHMYQSACTSYSSRVYVNNVSRMPSNKA